MKYIKFVETTDDFTKQEYLVNIDSIENISFKEKKNAEYHNQFQVKLIILWIITFISLDKKFEMPRYYKNKEKEELLKKYFDFLKSDDFIFDIVKESDIICGDPKLYELYL